jgi:type I restriction-modification system DNA methylase subunit
MPLFQQSVQKKFIKDLDKAKVEIAYQKLVAHFGNTDVQENIRKAKEEQYQEGFLRELFVDVLGYVLNPQPNYNLITEQKNEKDSKKADGAILKNNKPIAVIELKSVKTTDLQSIEIQAFNYKNNQTECVYVITSNFQKIRFYIENAVDFEEFDLFDISKERFDLLYLCLQSDNILSDLPLRIKQASLEREENITKKLYADYSLFKQTLFKDLSAQNRDLDKLTLFKKTQKLLDRFLFIFFAEDKGLLPPNSVSEILNQWDKLKELDAYQPLYNRFKLYFGYLNTGHKGKHYDIFAYNGGLFAPDDLLDNLTITDGVLYQHCRVLAHYDFDTEVDTNILGHIFEHSLNEVDEVAANTEGATLDKGKTKRKKDGIFYTPRYITKYIVESTVGDLCKQKKIALGLDNDALVKADTKKDRKLYQTKIDEYRNWLLHLTILDPACGSGAFLNQAFEFLLQEHRLIDSMTAMLFGDSLIMTDNVTEILENNIYGVDINEESVEIARLSLWLRTAKVGRKLNDLSRNIKVGNSLISDPLVAGDLAFDWQKAFPQVFEKGGFDVVIGNPPYLVGRDWKYDEGKVYEYCLKNYEVADYQFDMYVLFFERSVKLLNTKGIMSFITPNTWLNNQKTLKLRSYLLENTTITALADYSEVNVFKDAVVLPIITVLENRKSENAEVQIFKAITESLPTFSHSIAQNVWTDSDLKIINFNLQTVDFEILKKIEEKAKVLTDFAVVKFGIKIYQTGKGKPKQTPEMSVNKIFEADNQIDESYRPYLEGKDIDTYQLKYQNRWLKYGLHLAEPRPPALFEGQRLLVRRIVGKRLIATWIEGDYVTSQLLQIVKPIDEKNAKYLLGILNSLMIAFYFKKKYNRLDKTFPEIRVYELENMPIITTDNQNPMIDLVDNILNYNSDFQKLSTRFIKLLQSSFSNLTVNNKIETWYEMTFGEFRKELEKQKIAIPIKELMDYQELFETNAKEMKEIQTKINNTEKAIDKMVYALYDLTSEEIEIIEKG